MESFQTMLGLQSTLLLYLLIGIYILKRNIVPEQARPYFTNFLVRITLPCMVFDSFNREFTSKQLFIAAQVLLCAFIVCFFSYFIGLLFYKRVPAGRRSVMRYGTLISNGGFAGLPQVYSIYGSLGLFYGSIYLIPTRIFMWSAGISMFVQADRRTKVINVLRNPGIIAVFLGLARMLLQIQLPSAIDTAIQTVGNCTTPLSMIVIGMILADIPIKNVVDREVIFLSVVRLLIIPAVLLVVMHMLQTESVLTGVCVMLTAMPVGATTPVLAQKYGADSVFASKCVLVSTIASLITIPIISIFIPQ